MVDPFSLTDYKHAFDVCKLHMIYGFLLRRKMASLMRDMLIDEKIGHSLVKSILARYTDLFKDPNVRIVNLVEIISDIREPITTIEGSLNAEEQRKMDLQVHGLPRFRGIP